MTRAEVLSGMKFKWNGEVYAAQTMHNGGEGSLLLCLGSMQTHECNVESFGPYAMHWYTYVMGKRVSGMVNYKNLEAYVEAPKAEAA